MKLPPAADPSPANTIHNAVGSPNVDLSTVEAILLSGAAYYVNAVNPQNGHTPLHAACRRAHRGLIKLLVRYGADLEARAAAGETPLMVACHVSKRGCALCRITV